MQAQTPLLCWAWCVPCPCAPPDTPPGEAQREKSLTASAQSATLSNLQPDTEYVVMLRPRYAQKPSVPATLTARTRKYCAQPWAQLGLGVGSQHRDALLQSLCPIGIRLPGPLLTGPQKLLPGQDAALCAPNFLCSLLGVFPPELSSHDVKNVDWKNAGFEYSALGEESVVSTRAEDIGKHLWVGVGVRPQGHTFASIRSWQTNSFSCPRQS